MKQLLLAALATLSLNAFCQSYLVLENGIVVTIDKAGFVYDFGHYAFPQKVTLKGGKYFVEENSILTTVDDNGLLFRKYEVIPEKLIGKGINYFLSDVGTLNTINGKGVLTVSEHPEFTVASNFGGNYFMVPTDVEKKTADLYTINSEGVQSKANPTPIKLSEIVAYGGTYFMNNRGVVTSISGLTGAAIAHPNIRIGVLGKKGGNYFTDSSNTIFTVAEDGSIKVPVIPVNLKVTAITKLGSNYFLDLNGRLFVVDHNGDVFERTARDIDFRQARVISL
jgi:hypothetical protein